MATTGYSKNGKTLTLFDPVTQKIVIKNRNGFVWNYYNDTTGWACHMGDRVLIDMSSPELYRYVETRHIDNGTMLYTVPAPVPLPAAIWLFGTAIIGLLLIARKRKIE
jgi:hypothetical protein